MYEYIVNVLLIKFPFLFSYKHLDFCTINEINTIRTLKMLRHPITLQCFQE